MTLEEIRVGQRVRLGPIGDTNDDCEHRNGSVIVVDGRVGQVEVEFADGFVGVRSVTVSPEQLEPVQIDDPAEKSESPSRPRWWERVAETGASIPAADRAQIPRDAAENLDFYLYGWKRPGP